MSNRVKGPTSALSDFLRERGIKPRNMSMLSPKAAKPRPLEYESSNSDNDSSKEDKKKVSKAVKVKEESSPEPMVKTRNSRRQRQQDVKVEDAPMTASTTIPIADIGQAMRQRRAALRRKQQGYSDSEDEFQLDASSNKRHRSAGQSDLVFCKQCRRRFTVTDASRSLPNGGRLCLDCSAKAGKVPELELDTRGRRRGGKGNNSTWWLPEDDPVVSLRNACIKIIGENITNLSSLGSLNEKTMDKICQIICKHRQLSPAALKMFLNPSNSAIRLYDCTKLDEDDLKNVAHFCPSIHTLLLRYCGRLSPETTEFYADHLTNLHSITLHGPFLVTDAAFEKLVTAVSGRLRLFSVGHSARLSTRAITALVEKCSQLEELELRGCDALGDADILRLADASARGTLTTLNLSGTTSQVSDDTIIAVLRALGPKLHKLDLSNGIQLTDKMLTDGIAYNCHKLRELSLADCTNLTDDGVDALFKHWLTTMPVSKGSKHGLVSFNVARCLELTSKSLVPVLQYSGEQLCKLNLNGIHQTDDAVLEALSGNCPNLSWLDLSWCRAIDDTHLEMLYAKCPNLLVLKIWGCNRITEYVMPPHKNARLIGRECDTL
ncbi:hypothetical protein BDF19DRAFT_447488 [Syncephalis fuscata]|nr:hypothetical protein BDF19DRAFT_447488 [Syncephalis fuscata]